MITIQDFMKTIDYRITDGYKYGWNCFGPNAYRLESCTAEYDNAEYDNYGYSIGIAFDTKTQMVYEFEAHDYKNNRSYRWTHPDFIDAKRKEAKDMEVDDTIAYDEIRYTELEVIEDMLTKARCIFQGLEYDTRVTVPFDLADSELFYLMKMAHEKDITLNKLVETILEEVIKKHQS